MQDNGIRKLCHLAEPPTNHCTTATTLCTGASGHPARPANTSLKADSGPTILPQAITANYLVHWTGNSLAKVTRHPSSPAGSKKTFNDFALHWCGLISRTRDVINKRPALISLHFLLPPSQLSSSSISKLSLSSYSFYFSSFFPGIRAPIMSFFINDTTHFLDLQKGQGKQYASLRLLLELEGLRMWINC